MKQFLFLVGTIFLSSCTVVGVRNSEEAAYDVLLVEEPIQIRQYKDKLVAQTVTSGNYKESGGQAFDRLAGYIFGNNIMKEQMAMTTPVLEKKQSEKMAMTIPVYQQVENNSWTMTFVLPSKYSIETVPEPIDKNVMVRMLPGTKVATLRYNGLISAKSISSKGSELQTWLDDNGYKTLSEPYSAAYDPPWTIPFFRRNEVHIEIE